MAIVNIVREFIFNEKEASNFKCYVRGRWVPFDSSTINRVLKLRDIEFDEYFPFSHVPFDSQEIMDLLYGSNSGVSKNITNVTKDRALLNFAIQKVYTINTEKLILSSLIYIVRGSTSVARWKTREEKIINFSASYMNQTSKAWYYFISAYILPSKNISEVTKDRALLNFTIQKGHTISIGRLIMSSLTYIMRGSTSEGLGDPSLVYALYTVVGVRGDQNEE
ncbi:hypothetical protein IEQ34_017743 [Dendrobium chrysotoxum]|uniref:Putative plant transposon protein domain-containing protein n=1 Tax=Dendrobium chrysotoxum TaxID=161865 RepID=A0AAV7FUW2_DENCH|nr:hypothetical protein IEQ34_017743 [Dendrobium chrysotoxum]